MDHLTPFFSVCGVVNNVLTYLCSLQAGRHPEFDSLAHKFFTASASARDSLYKEALDLAAAAGAASKPYIRVMEKVVNGSAGYIEKESKR